MMDISERDTTVACRYLRHTDVGKAECGVRSQSDAEIRDRRRSMKGRQRVQRYKKDRKLARVEGLR